jgi:glutaredoxin 3
LLGEHKTQKLKARTTKEPKNQRTKEPKSQRTNKEPSMTRFDLLAQSQPNYNADAVRRAVKLAQRSGALATQDSNKGFKTGSQQEVEQVVRDNKVVLFTKTYCPYCKKAKELLESLKVAFVAFELDEMDELGKAVQASLNKMTKQSTVPSVFVGSKHVGGSDDLARLVEDNPSYFDNL